MSWLTRKVLLVATSIYGTRFISKRVLNFLLFNLFNWTLELQNHK